MAEGSTSAEHDPAHYGRGLLKHPVGRGRGALNDRRDVRIVQRLVNLAMAGGFRLEEDGRCDPALIDRIEAFQVKVLHFHVGDGRVDPNGRTLGALVKAASARPRPIQPPVKPPSPWYGGYVRAFDTLAREAEDDLRRLEAYLRQASVVGPPAPPPRLLPVPVRPAKPKVGGLTADQIRQIMPHAKHRADAYVDILNAAMAAHGIDMPEQRAALLGQISDETGQLHKLVEDLNYSAHRITQVWPSRFPTVESAQPYAHKPEALGNKVYGHRMGNGLEPSGDGFKYRGRGFLQITGRVKYRAAGMESNPDALADPIIAAETAASFWVHEGLNAISTKVLTRPEYNAMTVKVNGGHTGSQERWDAYQRALKALHCRGKD